MATVSPPKPSPFRCLLLEISKQLVEEDVENFKALLEDYGQEDDKGALAVEQLQKASTTFNLLMEAAKAGVIQPDDLSTLVDFLTTSGRIALVQKIEDFQKKNQYSAQPTDEIGHDQLEQVEYSLHHLNIHPTTYEQPGEGHSKQNSDPSPRAEAKPEQPTDDEGQLRRQQKIIPSSLVISVNIPVKLQNAMKFIVIGQYVDVFRSISCHLEKGIERYTRIFSGPFTGFSDEDGIILDFGLGTKQHLPVQALNHSAFARCDEYESIVQLIMEAILIAPNPEKNLATFLEYPNLHIPKSLQLLYRARLPSVATNQEMQDELARQSRHLADWLREEQQQANYASNRITLYLAQVYDATAFINRHQMKADFRAVFMQKADFHARAMEERQNYEPRTDLENAILKLESTRSAQSRGYAYAEMATNGPERPVTRREHAVKARVLHEEAIDEYAIPLLKFLHMQKGMSESAALVANLRFDEMLRILRLAQLDYKIRMTEWSEKERERILQCHLAHVVNEFGRIRDQLSPTATVVPVLQELLEKMEESMVPLKENVAEGRIKGFALNDPTMNE